MVLTRRFDPRRMRGRLASTVCAFLLLGVVATAIGDLPKDKKRRDRTEGGGLVPAAGNVLSRHVLDRNRVIMLLTDVGEIGSSGSSVAGGGFWLTTTNQYVFSSGPNIGALTPAGQIVVAIGGPFSELHYGSLEFPDFPNSSGLGHGVSSPSGIIWDSTIDDGLDMPDQCTVDAFRVAQFPTLQPFAGEPFPGFADQTVCMAVNDVTGGTCADCAGTRVGVEIVETMFTFGVPSVQDFVFVAFRVFNRTEFLTAATAPAQPAGPYDLEDTIVAIAVDPDIGEAGDDQIAFLPLVQTMVFWDSDFTEPQFQGVPGFGGITYLKTPIDPTTGEEVGLAEFTVFTNGPPRADPANKEVWYDLMTGDPTEAVLQVTPQDVRGMASSGRFPLPVGEFVEVYGAYFFANVSGSPPADLRAEAYKNQVTGAIIPDANDHPAFESFKTVQQTAQATFDAGFVVPTAPPKPSTQLVAGDHQVTILWGSGPLTFVNPFAKVARDPFARLATGEPDPEAEPTGVVLEEGQVIFLPERDQGGTTGFVTVESAGLVGEDVTNPAFNPNFVVQDFQGFRVYRSFTGLAGDAELIAQFDLVDAIVGGLFCIAATAVFDAEGEFVQNVCTAQVELPIGENTGLGFAVIDRGGSFPDPSDGPGLINGIPVSYSVTSFAVNCGESPVDVPEGTTVVPSAACLVLESGLAPFRSATPRSDASSFVAANVGTAVLLDGQGNPLPRDSGPIQADGGNVVGTIPPARDWDVNVSVVQPLEIPESFEVQIHFDDSPLSSAFNTGFCGGLPTAQDCVFEGDPPGVFEGLPAGDGRGIMMKLRVTDGDGNVLQTPTGPASDIRAAFGPLNFGAGTDITGPVIQILSPKNPANGVAFTLQYSTTIPGRSNNCALRGLCKVLTADGGGVPASVSVADFDRSMYGMPIVADIEITWSNQAGELTLSRVHDVSNNADYEFHPYSVTAGWGFARATSMPGPEADVVGGPRTPDGKFIFPEGLCFSRDGAAGCDSWGVELGFTQGEPIWSDLVHDPEIFETLPVGIYLTDFDLMQPDGLTQVAPVANTADGQRFARLLLAGQWLNLIFNQLPADGETWLVRFPSGPNSTTVDVNSPRPPVPGTAVSVTIQGGTSELAAADLSEITVVPNPFIAANEITRGRGLQRIQFTKLPPLATIRIFTISGNLVRVLEHSDGSGTAEWDVRTRFDLLVASGIYYYHVTTPDGRTHLGRFAVIN